MTDKPSNVALGLRIVSNDFIMSDNTLLSVEKIESTMPILDGIKHKVTLYFNCVYVPENLSVNILSVKNERVRIQTSSLKGDL